MNLGIGQLYTLDANGNRTGTTEVYGTYAGAVSTFTYDAKDRLTQDATSAPLAHTYTYTYDSRDNILTNSESGGVVQMNYDAASRLTTSTSGGVTTTYTFDSNGNLTGVNEAGTLTTMVYDKENRLKEHRQGAAANTRTFAYDLNSLKQSSTVSKATDQLVWDGADMLGEVPAVKPVGAPLMPTRYNLAQGILFATTRFEPAATRTDTGADFIGSILIDFDENGDYVAERRYKPYGELLAGTATTYGWTGNTGSRATLLQFAEQYNRRRHYSTKLKQWTTRDPLWPEESAYGYVNGNPLTWTDPSGTSRGVQFAKCVNKYQSLFVGLRNQEICKLCKRLTKSKIDCESIIYTCPPTEPIGYSKQRVKISIPDQVKKCVEDCLGYSGKELTNCIKECGVEQITDKMLEVLFCKIWPDLCPEGEPPCNRRTTNVLICQQCEDQKHFNCIIRNKNFALGVKHCDNLRLAGYTNCISEFGRIVDQQYLGF